MCSMRRIPGTLKSGAKTLPRSPRWRFWPSRMRAGVLVAGTLDGRSMFITGHLEYDRDTLDAEYRRDVAQGDGDRASGTLLPR